MGIAKRLGVIVLGTLLTLNCVLGANKVQAEDYSRDINGDGIIDIQDIAQLAKYYNVKASNSNWKTIYDYNNDNVINIYDIVTVSKVLGQPVVESMAGNTSGNFANDSFATLKGGFIYYQKGSDGYKIYREKLDGSEKSRVSDSWGGSVNVVDDWVYYKVLGPFGESGIFKVKKDGSQKTKLSDYGPMFMYVVDNWIYYAEDIEETRRIYRLKTDGSVKEEIKLRDGNLGYLDGYGFNVEGDWIYTNVLNRSMGKVQFYRVKVDGSAENLILDEKANFFSVVNNLVYYIAWTPSIGYKEICRIKPDGTEKNVVFREETNGVNIYSFNISNENIYFSTEADNQQDKGIYGVNMEGNGLRKLTDSWCRAICTVGDWIYFDGSDGYRKIKVDGTGETVVN